MHMALDPGLPPSHCWGWSLGAPSLSLLPSRFCGVWVPAPLSQHQRLIWDTRPCVKVHCTGMEGRGFGVKSCLRHQNKLDEGGNGEPLFWMRADSGDTRGGGCAESLSGPFGRGTQLSCV